MSTELEFVVRAVVIGVGATAALDLWGLFLLRAFRVQPPYYTMVGRWLGHMPRGRFAHRSIGAATPVRGEAVLGWAFHYAVGVFFAAVLLATVGLEWAHRPTPLPALAVGVLTVAAPFFLMQPAMGFGIAAANAPNPTKARLRSLATHLAFGVGLYLAALASAALIP